MEKTCKNIMQTEAVRRLKKFEAQGLDQRIVEDYQMGHVPVSELHSNGALRTYTLEDAPSFVLKAIEALQRSNESLFYYVLVSLSHNPHTSMVALLTVDPYPEEWNLFEEDLANYQTACAVVYNLGGKFIETGEIVVDTWEGRLVRVG